MNHFLFEIEYLDKDKKIRIEEANQISHSVWSTEHGNSVSKNQLIYAHHIDDMPFQDAIVKFNNRASQRMKEI